MYKLIILLALSSIISCTSQNGDKLPQHNQVTLAEKSGITEKKTTPIINLKENHFIALNRKGKTQLVTANFADSFLVYRNVDTLFHRRLITPEEAENDIEEAYETEYTTISFKDSSWEFQRPSNNQLTLNYYLQTENNDSITSITNAMMIDSFTVLLGKTLDNDGTTGTYVWVLKGDSIIYFSMAKQYSSCEYSDLSLYAIVKSKSMTAIALKNTYDDIDFVQLGDKVTVNLYYLTDYDPAAYVP